MNKFSTLHPEVSVIIVNWNTEELLLECLLLYRNTYEVRCEIILLILEVKTVQTR